MELFKIVGTVALDNSGAIAGIDATVVQAEKAQTKLSKVFTNVGKFAVNAGKVIATGLAVGTAAIAGMTKQSMEAYAEFEQLVGGVETLFGAGGQSLKEYADSVGKSTSEVKDEYMELLKAQKMVFNNADKA